MTTLTSHRSFGAAQAGAALLAALMAAPAVAANELQPFAESGDKPAQPWHVVGLPQQDPAKKPFTAFSIETKDGKRALKVDADHSYGNLVHPLTGSTAHTLSWAWRLDALNDAADLTQRQGDDTAVKVCASFDLPLDKVPFVERQLLKVARGKTTEPVPTATICYVWDNALAVGTRINSAFTGRLRYIVLRSGNAGLGSWQNEKRDLADDFKKSFGDESPEVPPVVAIGVGADADNTARHSVAWVADVTLAP
jgi:hypothetical protein